jgi:hypothetical protein
MQTTVAQFTAIFLISFSGLALPACARRARVSPGLNISSEHSDYSPALRLAVSLPPLLSQPDSIVVLIDSGIVTAAGIQPPKVPAELNNLYITALLTARAIGPIRDARTPPWTASAESDSILIADSLRLGESRTLPSMRFVMRRPPRLDPSHTTLVFRITGIALDEQRDPGKRGSIIHGGRVRVYACADWTLDGFVDQQQRNALAEAYNAAC